METQFSQALKWLPNVIALIAACYGIAFQQSILQSSRPLLPTNLEPKSGQRAYARLWDDPFVVFPQDRNPPLSDCPGCLPDEAPTLLAFVLLDSLRYAEDNELRLRSRFAVQKALADLDYVPENPEVLENLPYPVYLKPKRKVEPGQNDQQTFSASVSLTFLRRASYRSNNSHRNPTETKQKSPEIEGENPETDENPGIPFQDFQLRAINRFSDTNNLLEKALPAGSRLQFGRIRVFWLDENVLSENTLVDLPRRLADHKRDFADPNRQNPLSIVVFGPSNSASLTQMVSLQPNQDQRSTWPPSTKADVPNSELRVINYQATAANDYIKLFAYQQKCLEEIYNKPIEASLDNIRPDLERPLLSLGPPNNLLSIERTGCSDYQLCEALLGEVRRRTPFFVQRKPKIMVFYETDTLYGRALALTLETLAKFPHPANPLCQSEQLLSRLFSETDKDAKFRVEMNGYFRGLDGFSSYYRKQYISAQSGSSDDTKGSSAQGSSSKPVGLDHAEGSSQFDYIRRICNLIDRNDPPCAIALFGTDIFDKLSLLSILHEKLPDAMYLSTQLDSRYLAPENLAFTRNLIVVSPFGLSPMDDNGRKPARSISFRDSNQTALYKAVQSAVLGIHSAQTGPDLYEIGNLHAVPMATTNVREDAVETHHESPLDGTNPVPSMGLQLLVIATGTLFLFFAIRPTILRARDFPAELAEPLIEALKTPDLRELAGALCKLKGAFERRWSETNTVDDDLPSLDRIRSAGSRVQEEALKSFVAREIDQLAERLHHLAARNLSILKIRVFPAFACNIANRLQFSSEQRIFDKFRRNLEDKLLNEQYVDAASFPELDSLNCYRRLPGFKVALLELLAVTATTVLFFAVCRRLAPYSWGLVGFEFRDQTGQFWRALLGFTEVWLTLWITVIVCREQLVCEMLIRKFAKFIDKASGLTSRRTILVIALRSDPVSKLSLYPCSLLFLLFVAHMKSLQGAPTTVAHIVAALSALLLLFVTSNQVRMAANDARNRCLREYKIDILRAERARATLASVFSDEHLPLQDSLARAVEDVNDLGQKNSLGSTRLMLPGRSPNFVLSEVDLRKSVSRESIMRYLEALIERNRHVVDFISNLESGALTSLILSPLVAALLIPIGGAGGLTVFDYLVKLFRA